MKKALLLLLLASSAFAATGVPVYTDANKIHGKRVEPPTAASDGKAMVYVNASGMYKHRAATSGGSSGFNRPDTFTHLSSAAMSSSSLATQSAAGIQHPLSKTTTDTISRPVAGILQSDKVINSATTVWFLGDSNTLGTVGGTTGFVALAQSGWPAAWTGTTWTINNEGVGGASSDDVFGYELPMVTASNSMLFVLMIGTNDSGTPPDSHSVLLPDYELWVTRTISSIAAMNNGTGLNNGQPRLVLMTPPPVWEAGSTHSPTYDAWTNAGAATYAQKVRDLGMKYGIPVIDVNNLFPANGTYLQSDGIHLTNAAHTLVYNALTALLTGMETPQIKARAYDTTFHPLLDTYAGSMLVSRLYDIGVQNWYIGPSGTPTKAIGYGLPGGNIGICLYDDAALGATNRVCASEISGKLSVDSTIKSTVGFEYPDGTALAQAPPGQSFYTTTSANITSVMDWIDAQPSAPITLTITSANTDHEFNIRNLGTATVTVTGSTASTTVIPGEIVKIKRNRDSGSWGYHSTFTDQTNKRVGYGTASPLQKLHIKATSTSESPIMLLEAQGTGAPAIYGYKSLDSSGSPAALADNTVLFGLYPFGYDGSAYAKFPYIQSRTVGAWSGSSTGADWRFATIPSGSTTVAERMRLPHDGGLILQSATEQACAVVGDIGRMNFVAGNHTTTGDTFKVCGCSSAAACSWYTIKAW